MVSVRSIQDYQFKDYRHPKFPELHVVENHLGEKSYYISVEDLPEVPKQIFQLLENLKELQKNQFLSHSFKVLLKSEIQILEQKLQQEIVKYGYPYDVSIIPF